jgi:hypothetical protein
MIYQKESMKLHLINDKRRIMMITPNILLKAHKILGDVNRADTRPLRFWECLPPADIDCLGMPKYKEVKGKDLDREITFWLLDTPHCDFDGMAVELLKEEGE